MVLKHATVMLFVGSAVITMATVLYYQRLHSSEAQRMQQHSVTSFSAGEGEFLEEKNKYLVTPSVRTSQFEKFSPLPQQVIDHVEKFVFFIGYRKWSYDCVKCVGC